MEPLEDSKVYFFDTIDPITSAVKAEFGKNDLRFTDHDLLYQAEWFENDSSIRWSLDDDFDLFEINSRSGKVSLKGAYHRFDAGASYDLEIRAKTGDGRITSKTVLLKFGESRPHLKAISIMNLMVSMKCQPLIMIR